MKWSDLDDYNGDDAAKLAQIFNDFETPEPQRQAISAYIQSYGRTALGIGLLLGLVIGIGIG